VPVKSKWIEHKGKKIFLSDYSGFQDFNAFKAEVDYSTSITITQPDDSVLLLVDVTDTAGNQEMVDYITKSANKDKEKMKKTAVIGVSGYRRIFLRTVVRLTGMSVKDFDDIEKAKDWLVKNESS
jgi:threonine synthase